MKRKIKLFSIGILLIYIDFFSSSVLYGQGGLPAIVISNSNVNITNCWVVDTDSLRGNYAFGNTTTTLTVPAGSQMGIFLDSLHLRSDNDFINFYDGNSTAATLLSSITRSSVTAWSFKTSGNVVTILFHAQNDIPVPGVGWRVGVRSINTISGNLPSFTPVFQAFAPPGNIDMADYDNDGDKDLLIDGNIYQNLSGDDSLYLFNRAIQPLGAWSSANMVSADFNADGLKDIFMTGVSNLSGTFIPTTALFRNNGNNTFTRITIAAFTNVGAGVCAVTDLNADGKPDITYTGSINLNASGAIFKIFINTGNFGFTELSNNLPGLIDSNMDWFDYDNDGDPDIVLNGYNNSGSLSALYKNNGNGSFALVNLPPFFATSSGMIKWVDANGDGKKDFINTGVTTPGNVNAIIPELLMNNGGDNFTRLITNLPARWRSNLDAYDYDGDGDADFVLSGFVALSPDTDAGLYKNNGAGNFTRVAYRPGVQSTNGVKWIDLNGDNKKDLYVCGRGNLDPSFVFLNMGADSFRVASYPFTNYALGGGSSSNVLVDDLNGDGLPDFVFAGIIDDQDCAEGNSSAYIYSQSWLKRPYTGFQNVKDLRSVPGLTVTAGSFWRWGDVNNDGKPDIILTNGNEPLRIIKNDGNNNFSLMYSGYINPAKVYEQAGVVDIDNDGTNELYVVPNKLYKWNGTSFQTLYEAPNIGCEGGPATFIGCLGYFDFADYTRDGFTDVAFVQGAFIYLLRNNGAGRFVNDYPSYFTTLGTDGTAREIRWFDYDADGDPDLITRQGIYENTAWGGIRPRGLTIPDFGNIGFSDFNKDGKLDVVTINRAPPNLGPGHIFYNQQGASFFNEITPPNFFNSYGGSYRVGIYLNDLDNDGDDDIVYATGGDCTHSGVYINRYNDSRSNIHLFKPNGGEVFAIGSTMTIRWTGYQLGNSVKLEISTDGGNSYVMINASAPGNSYGGQYNWTINGVSASTQCKVRITDNISGQLVDISDKNFTITAITSVSSIVRNNDFKIYPNPASGDIYCVIKNVPQGKKVHASMFDLQGREVLSTDTRPDSNGMFPLNGSFLKEGYYLIRVSYNNIVNSQKIIILR
jgi:hypothetical protein